MLLE
jgi:nitroimidazol reductase NimA-like FMN-containing flavoprotein (pyridoxamine 5'-phosphate oxidase superfamily)